MLSKEQYEKLKYQIAMHKPVSSVVAMSVDSVESLFEMIDKLEENATAQALALKAAKAMQQAETERADKAESELQRIHKLAQCGTVQNFLALSDDEKGKAFAVMMRTDKAQIDMINELEARADANERDAERYRKLLNGGDGYSIAVVKNPHEEFIDDGESWGGIRVSTYDEEIAGDALDATLDGL